MNQVMSRALPRVLLAALFVFAVFASIIAEAGVVASGNARFTVITPELIRLEYSGDARFEDATSLFAIDRHAEFNDFEVTRVGEPGRAPSVEIRTARMQLSYHDDGRAFHAGNLSISLVGAGPDGSMATRTTWTPGTQARGNLGGTIATLDGVVGPLDLGDGLLSRDGWHVIDDSARPLVADGWAKSRPTPRGIDWYFFGYGRDYKAALKSLTAVSGPVPMPRKQLLGSWYSRYWPYSSDDYRQLVAEHTQYSFPLDIIVMDMDWHANLDSDWTGWTWNRKLLPDAEGLLQWFHSQGLAVTLNDHPAAGVGPQEESYTRFMNALGLDPSTRKTVPWDAGNRSYMNAFFEQVHAPLERQGVDFWWLDWQQSHFTRSIPDLTHLEWLNRQYFERSRTEGKRGVSFSRWGGWGDHRYPIHFSGDASTEWKMLEFEVPFTSTAGNVGCFFWSHDIGGHMGPRYEETFVRWAQFGAMTAALRLHSTRSAELDRRPWLYGPEALTSLRGAFHLRSELFPHIYSSVRRSTADSIPLIRPMYLEYAEQDEAYRNPQQYQFGDAFIVAPITSAGKGAGKLGSQAVWFPKGADWYDWFTGARIESGNHLVTATLQEFPLYAKGGVPILMQPYRERMTTAAIDDLHVRVYPGERGETSLYEDDGLTDAYERGELATTQVSYRRVRGEIIVEVSPTVGTYRGALAERTYLVELPSTSPAASASIDGQPLAIEYDATTFTNRVRVAKRRVADGFALKVAFADAATPTTTEINATLTQRALRSRLRALTEASLDQPGGLTSIVADQVRAHGVDATTEGLLALGGVSVRLRSPSVYGYPADKTLVVAHTGSPLLTTSALRLEVLDTWSETSSAALTATCAADAGRCEHEMPRFSPPGGSSPALGLKGRRQLRATMEIGGVPVTLTTLVQESDTYVTRWNAIGPFDYSTAKPLASQSYGPETESFKRSSTYVGNGGARVGWKSATADSSGAEAGVLDIAATIGSGGSTDDKLGYATALLESPIAQDATLRISSDDGVELWVNGAKVHSKDVQRDMNAGPDVVRIPLKAGTNELRAKVSNGVGGWALRVGVEAGVPLRELD